MAAGLSSNWKKLQAQIKAESTALSSSARDSSSAAKRKNPHSNSKNTQDDNTTSRNPRKRQRQHTQKPPAKANSKPAPKPMGTTSSSQLSTTHPHLGVAPSAQLWASENDITPESLAEAYGLGLSSTSLNETPARPNEGLSSDVVPGKYLGIDCEMVGVGPGGQESALARVSLVDFHGQQVYDSYVRPLERVTDWRTALSGVSPRHMATAREFDEVQRVVAGLLRDRIIVGHDVKHDLEALMLTHPLRMVRDTAKFSGFKKYGHGPKPKLRVLAKELLGVEIQQGQHSSIEDARVAMLLFRRHKSAFDVEIANKFPDPATAKEKGGQRGKKNKRRRN